ncbi:MAG TPA: hypothetical protein VGB89_14170 [Bacteroidota bacterium]
MSEDKLSRIAGANWWTGSDDIKLGRAAKAYDCELRMIRRKKALRAHYALLLSLRRGYPALLCVDDWNHWITVVGAEKDKIIYIDSRKAPVVNISSWKQLKDRWIYVDSDQEKPQKVEVMFDLHPVIPKFRVDRKRDSPWCEHGISAVPRTAGLLHTGTNTLMTFRPSAHRVRHTAPAGFHWESSCVDMAR